MEIQTIQPFLHYLKNVRERTLRVARCIPPDKIDWTYAEGKFTLGDLLRHIAVSERYMWAENIQGHPSRYTTHGKELAVTFEDILALMNKLHAESVEIFSRLTEADLQKKCITSGDAAYHHLEVAPPHDRTRNPPPRPNLSLPIDPERSHSPALRSHVRTSPRHLRQISPLTLFLNLPL